MTTGTCLKCGAKTGRHGAMYCGAACRKWAQTKPPYKPSRKQIRKMCQLFQSGWTDQERQSRMVFDGVPALLSEAVIPPKKRRIAARKPSQTVAVATEGGAQ